MASSTSAEVVYTAVLPVSCTGVPALLPSIWNCTVPVSPLPLVGVTVAVKVTGCPGLGRRLLDVTAVVVEFRAITVRFTVEGDVP